MASNFAVKDVEHKPTLVSVDTKDAEYPMHLWRVTVSHPLIGIKTHYVMAPYDVDAVRMAECASGILSNDIGKEEHKNVVSTHEKLPFCISGWGKNQF